MIPYYLNDIKEYLSEDDITLQPEISKKVLDSTQNYRDQHFEDYNSKYLLRIAKSLGAMKPDGSILIQ